MKVKSSEDARFLAYIAVSLRAQIPDLTWELLYEKFGNRVGGFPGVEQAIGNWAYALFRALPEQPMQLDLIEVIATFTDRICDFARSPTTLELPSVGLAGVTARALIRKGMNTNARH